ncbi:MAG: hypothetical protein ACXADH_05065, partial [Candidatus Kariarchaeaceae archaeon]
MANLSNINNKFIVADVATATRVSIGITTTNNLLTLFGTGAGNATLQIEGEGGADPYINFLANNAQHWSLGVDDSDSDKFKLSEHSALGANDYFVVDTSGNVGIGTNSPNRKLTVQSGSYTYPSTGIDTNSYFAIANNSWAGMNILSSNATGGFIDFGDTDYGHRGRILYGHATDYMAFDTAGTTKIRIDSSGNLLVGTDTVLAGGVNRGNITINGASNSILSFGIAEVLEGYLYHDGSEMKLNTGTASLVFEVNGVERQTIDSSGNSTFAGTVTVNGTYLTLGGEGYIRSDDSGYLHFQGGTTGTRFFN